MIPSRQQDERLLEMVRLRSLGHTSQEVAAQMGCVRSVVSGQTKKVLDADSSHSASPDEQSEIKRIYWKH